MTQSSASLIKFEEVSFDVANEEWKQGIEAAAEINFSAAAAAALWADGAAWSGVGPRNAG